MKAMRKRTVWAAAVAMSCLPIGCGDSFTDLSGIAEMSLSYASEAGDPVGEGKTRRYTFESGTWAVETTSLLESSGLQRIGLIFFNTAGVSWTFDVRAPEGEALQPGMYSPAGQYPRQTDDQPGINFSEGGRTCDGLSGEFTVRELVLGAANTINRLHVEFTQTCANAAGGLSGEVRIRATGS